MAMGSLSCWPRSVSSPTWAAGNSSPFFCPPTETARHPSGLHRINKIMSAGLGSSVCLDFNNCAFLARRNEDAAVVKAFASRRRCRAPSAVLWAGSTWLCCGSLSTHKIWEQAEPANMLCLVSHGVNATKPLIRGWRTVLRRITYD
jgi:hypothetical protein